MEEMYSSHAKFVMPNEADEIIQLFIEIFSQNSFESESEAIKNSEDRAKLENNPFFPFCLLKMIKEFFVDGNEIYGRNISLISGLFNRLYEKNKAFKDLLHHDIDYKQSLLSTILYILPYAASFFKNANEILIFKNLYSALIREIDVYDPQTIGLFNQYIYDLLHENEINISHNTVLVILFANSFSIMEQNCEAIYQLINFLLQFLPDCSFHEETERLIYQNLFKRGSFLINCIFDNKIEILPFLQSIYNFTTNFINNSGSNEGNIEINFIIELLDQIIKAFEFARRDYHYQFEKESSPAICTIRNLTNIFYKKAVNLVKASKSILSSSISNFLSTYAKFIKFEKPAEFVMRFYCLSIFSQKDKEELINSEELFYYDFYDIENIKNCFSQRQYLFQLINKLVKKNIFPDAINILADALNSLNQDKIFEFHFFLMSVINIIINNVNLDESQKDNFYQLTTKYLYLALEIFLPQLVSQEDFFRNTNKKIFAFSIYFFINSSFSLLSDDEIENFNNVVDNLMTLIEAFKEKCPEDNQIRTFYTFYCILTLKLFERQRLTVDADQIVSFTDKYFEYCITNDAINLMNNIALDGGNQELLLNVFGKYFDECERMLSEITSRIKLENDDDDDEDSVSNELFDIPEDKESDYLLRFFGENVSKMSKIIKLVDFSNFEEIENRIEKVLSITITKGEDWPFQNECFQLITSILLKASDFKKWTQIYMENAISSGRAYFGEYINPIIMFISERAKSVDQDYILYIFDRVKDGILNEREVSDSKIATVDALNLFALLIRLFELSISSDIQIPNEIVTFYLNLAFESIPNEKDVEDDKADYHINDYKLGFNMLKLASFLTEEKVDINELVEFLQLIANEGQLVCNEIRYIAITLIDNVIKPDKDNELNDFRNLCLTNEIKYENAFKEIYNANSKYLLGYVKHPIYDLYPIQDFVFVFDDLHEEDENEEGEDE